MKFPDINKVYTQYVADYIAKGYTINAGTMNGSQGEIAHVDFTGGKEIIRVLMDEEVDYESGGLRYVRIVAGKATDKVKPNEKDHGTIWNQRLESVKETRFWEVGETRKGKFYGTKEEALEAERKRRDRYIAKRGTRENDRYITMTPELVNLAKSYLRRKARKSRIYGDSIRILRSKDHYAIMYQGSCYKLK